MGEPTSLSHSDIAGESALSDARDTGSRQRARRVARWRVAIAVAGVAGLAVAIPRAWRTTPSVAPAPSGAVAGPATPARPPTTAAAPVRPAAAPPVPSLPPRTASGTSASAPISPSPAKPAQAGTAETEARTAPTYRKEEARNPPAPVAETRPTRDRNPQRMKLLQASLFVSALASVSGCPTRSKYDQLPIVRITSPAPDTYTKGTVTIAAAIDPHLDLPIVLRVDDIGVIKILASPSESYAWNTIALPEGAYTLVAEVELSTGPVTSPPVIVNVDRRSPTVTLTPAPGSENVILRSPIKASFSEPVVLSRPAGETFSLSTAATTVPATVTFDAQNQTATIAIADLSSVSLPAAFTATIAPTITDRAGNLLVPPTNTWSWIVPDWITFPRLESGYRPVLAIGSDLLPALAWSLLTNPGGVPNYQLQVAKYDGFGWTQLGPPSSNINSAGNGMDVSLDAENRPLAIWRETSVDFQVAAWTGISWDTSFAPLSAAFGPDPDAGAAMLRLDSVGRPVVMWLEQAPSGRRYAFLARWNGAEWDRFDPIELPAFISLDMIAGEKPIVSWIFPAGHRTRFRLVRHELDSRSRGTRDDRTLHGVGFCTWTNGGHQSAGCIPRPAPGQR